MLNPNSKYPLPGTKRLCFLKNLITNSNISIGDYSYYDDPEDVNNFLKDILYHFDFVGDKLIIGKFCQIATGVRFVMNGGNHAVDGWSTYPFAAFGNEWANVPLNAISKGDTVIGNDVWIGNSATIMPGVHIGDGAIIATSAVVTKNVGPYNIVGGNPAKLIRGRFDDETKQALINIKWWDWEFEKICLHAVAIATGNLEFLKLG